MSFNISKNIKYVKHNRAILKQGKREISTKMLLDFFQELEGKVQGLKGFAVMDNLKNEQESIVLTFWENKEDMDAFYLPTNKDLSDFVEKAKPFFEQLPQRNDYIVSAFNI